MRKKNSIFITLPNILKIPIPTNIILTYYTKNLIYNSKTTDFHLLKRLSVLVNK